MTPRPDTPITLQLPARVPMGEIVAANVPAEEFMQRFADGHYEWIEGIVIKMSPVSLQHDQLVAYLRRLFEAYFSLRKIGQVVGEPYVMRLPNVESRREPDLQVILGPNQANLTPTYMDGPADIALEVVSVGSVAVDYGEKLAEYEQGGVGEYWLIDPIRSVAHFHRLTDAGVYGHHRADDEGNYRSPRLPDFRLHVPTLWGGELPDYGAVWQAVQAMVGEGE